MAELDKNRSGLQKPVSSVFKGVPMPPSNNNQPSGSPAPNPAVTEGKPKSPDEATSPSSLMARLSQSEETIETNEQASKAVAPAKPPVVNKPKQQEAPIEKPAPLQQSRQQAAPTEQPEDELVVETTGSSFVQNLKDKLFTAKPDANTTKQKAMVILIPILAIIMIFMFRQVLSKSPNKTKGAANDGIQSVAVSDPHEIDWKIPDPLPPAMRDPLKFADQQTTQTRNGEQGGTVDGTTGTRTSGSIDIKDILFSVDKPSAVVGNRIVYVGDKVGGAAIVKINKDSIEFEKDDKRWIQTIND